MWIVQEHIMLVLSMYLLLSSLTIPFCYHLVPLYAPVYIPGCPQLLQLCSAATIHLAYEYLAALS
jgi:hypothetical protein